MKEHLSIPERLTLYSDLMAEIKVRTKAISDTLTANNSGALTLPHVINQEFFSLQLRLICEVIALACLVAHYDMPKLKSAKAQSRYKADAIIGHLDRLHEDFYPKPCTIKFDDKGAFSLKSRECDHLGKTELKSLYRKTGTLLHRGSLKTFNEIHELKASGPNISTYVNKIINLLDAHTISLAHPRRKIVVQMSTMPGDRVRTYELHGPIV